MPFKRMNAYRGDRRPLSGPSLGSRLLLCVLFLMLGVPIPAFAQVSLTLKLDRTEASLADSVGVVVSISGVKSLASAPRMHGLESFNTVEGGKSSRIEIINGKVRSEIDYNYAIQPKKIGSFQIGPAEITVQGKSVKSNMVTLKVVRPTPRREDQQGPLFLTAALSTGRVYVEEQVVYTLKLYRQIRVTDISLDLPEEKELSFKQLAKPVEYESQVRGQAYQVLEVRYLLIPSKAGTFGIAPSRMSMTVYENRRRSPYSLFDDPFFSMSSGRPRTVASEPLELEVLALPEQGRPGDFSGLVGNFKIESNLEPARIKAGGSATFTVVLSGRGNVKRFPDLRLPEIDQTKVYSDQPVLDEVTDADGLSGSKTMKWALVPEKEGQYQVPPLSVSYFDPGARKYRRIKTSPTALSVLPGEEEKKEIVVGKEQKDEGPSKQEVEAIGHDILPVHGALKDLGRDSLDRPGGIPFWLMLLAPLSLYIAAFWILRFRKKSDTALAAIKAKRAAKDLSKRCRLGGMSANQLLSSLRDYMNDRFGLSLGALTSQDAFEILESRGIRPETAEKIRDLVQELEDAVYTGRGNNIHPDVEVIPALIRRIEREIR